MLNAQIYYRKERNSLMNSELDIEDIRDLNLYKKVECLSRYEHKPLYKVKYSGQYYILKLQEKNDLKHLPILRRLHSFASKNEVKIYGWLSDQQFDYVKYPGLVKVQNYDILIEYIPSAGNFKGRVTHLIRALHELYRKSSELKLGHIHSFLHKWRYSSQATILKGSFSVIRREMGLWKAFKTLYIALVLSFKQPKLRHEFLLHNDLTINNIIIDEVSGDPHIIDFQAASKESRWLLNDIVRYAFRGDKKIIDFDIVNEFIEGIDNEYFGDDIKLEAQVRYAMIARAIQSLLNRPKNHIIDFFKNILLDGEKFNVWFKQSREK